MRIPIDEELLGIFKDITSRSMTGSQWAEVESDDEFQTDNFCGGYDADEQAFCFSWHSSNGEFWFQVSLSQVQDAVAGETVVVNGRRPD